jgi:hypothetical protein
MYKVTSVSVYEGISKSFRTGRLERELQILRLSATRCSCIAILWVILVSFATITFASQPVVIIVIVVIIIYFVIDSVRKLFDTPSYNIGSLWCAHRMPRSPEYTPENTESDNIPNDKARFS